MTNERSSMIDWDTAVSVGARLAGEGPVGEPGPRPTTWSPSCAPGPSGRRPLVRGFTGLVAEERTAPVLVVDRRGWLQANVDGFGEIVSPLIDKLQAKKGAAVAVRARGRLPGDRRRARADARVHEQQGARPVRPVPRARPVRAGRLLLVAPNIVHVERELERRPARLPALGVPARGDPPGAVHRRPVDARPPPLRDGEDHRRGPDRPVRDAVRRDEEGRRPGQRQGRGQPPRPGLLPGAEGR